MNTNNLNNFEGDQLQSGYFKNIAEITKQDIIKKLQEDKEKKELDIKLNPFPFVEKKTCLHEKCNECHGSGRKSNGVACFHFLSCPCPKCNPYFL